jgi:hypothetical protein
MHSHYRHEAVSRRLARGLIFGVLLRGGSVSALIALMVIGVMPAVATARTPVSTPPEGGGIVENTDGTFSLWGREEVNPGQLTLEDLRTYRASEVDKLEKMFAGLEVDSGNTGQTASSVSGITEGEIDEDARMEERLETDKLYATPGEEAVGSDLVEDDVAGGFLPSVGAVADAANGAILLAGSAYVGVKIGNGVDELLGLPKLELSLIESFFHKPNEFARSHIEKHFLWDPRIELGHVKKCTELEATEHFTGPGKGECGIAAQNLTEYESYIEHEKAETEGPREEGLVQEFTETGGPGPECATSWLSCQKIEPKEGEHGVILWDEPGSSNRKEFTRDNAFPDHLAESFGSFDSEHHIKELGEGTPPPPVTTPVPAVVPTTVDQPVTEWIAHEEEHRELPGIEGEPVPDPTRPEILPVEHDELTTHYQDRLESEGLTDVKVRIRTEADTDPEVGPNEVASVSPASGTDVDPGTEVDVEGNPEDAPVPGEGGGGVPPPTLPGIHTPKFGALCKNFPFGIPCWLIGVVGEWSKTSSTPNLGWNDIPVTLGGISTTIPAAHFSLAPLEPVMEIVRPAMVIFASIGLVLFFYKVSTGGAPSSGSHGEGDAGGGGATDGYAGLEGM